MNSSEVVGQVVAIRRRGGPGVLQSAPRTFGAPGPGEIRIAAEFAGVAYGDLLLREGLGGPIAGGGVVPGYDSVGRIDAVGAGVIGYSIGQRVVARTDGRGGYGSHLLVSTESVTPVPENVDAADAVALVLNYVTAWQMLTRVAPVGAGGTVLVHGAAGGVGSALAELAVSRGLRVIGTASGTRVKQLSERGVEGIDRTGKWAGQVRRIAPDGIDAAFDGVGGAVGRRSLGLLGAGGKLVTYGASGALRGGRRSFSGIISAAAGGVRMSALATFTRGIGLDGYLSSTYVPAHLGWFRDDLTALLSLLSQKKLQPVIGARFQLSEVGAAHELLARGTSGKILLAMPGA
ncbi:MAG: Alcohol dehydrogenase zinc-binding domain protein [Subtercola sp.]|nr:Alcohol dehydrogenase zinc-binding domain protein [Subtercola sp.]